jgi:L-alanine-DL-glutamate epimerase-like enolase superfamily enzyme
LGGSGPWPLLSESGLNRERFAPRQLAASEVDLTDEAGTNLDPFRAWRVMMTNEKPGGHGERCVAVGALDMALWDAAAKIARLPLYRLLMDRTGTPQRDGPRPVSVYAGGGYYYPSDDIARLSDEVRCFRDLGYRRAKIKIGNAPLAQDLKRIRASPTIRRSCSCFAKKRANWDASRWLTVAYLGR